MRGTIIELYLYDPKKSKHGFIEGKDGNKYWGVGTHADIILASVNALVSALNRMNKKIHFVK